MLSFVKKVLIAWLVFVLLGSLTGGGPFRSLGGQVGGVAQKVIDAMADKADDLKDDAGLIIDQIRELAGVRKGIAENTPGNT